MPDSKYGDNEGCTIKEGFTAATDGPPAHPDRIMPDGRSTPTQEKSFAHKEERDGKELYKAGHATTPRHLVTPTDLSKQAHGQLSGTSTPASSADSLRVAYLKKMAADLELEEAEAMARKIYNRNDVIIQVTLFCILSLVFKTQNSKITLVGPLPEVIS